MFKFRFEQWRAGNSTLLRVFAPLGGRLYMFGCWFYRFRWWRKPILVPAEMNQEIIKRLAKLNNVRGDTS
jgi:hypothetical protein